MAEHLTLPSRNIGRFKRAAFPIALLSFFWIRQFEKHVYEPPPLIGLFIAIVLLFLLVWGSLKGGLAGSREGLDDMDENRVFKHTGIAAIAYILSLGLLGYHTSLSVSEAGKLGILFVLTPAFIEFIRVRLRQETPLNPKDSSGGPSALIQDRAGD
ncbi:hypothetical protein [Microvirga arsenatis]|uniref:Uncharacterized protein n=1 Tax=Microvirga arsenatis TaxID=2692265 RepID=A0ABW9YRV6_9HYPH|nr:hypothetical protein [Microvirga arsenatis]NBJ09935.1 hypothetical protein [Microvirga arsenatis]NBJ23003.1 hypothetical protein [Microvirga arsenatis]